MNETLPALTPERAGQIMESVIVKGDLDQLSPAERAKYYVRVCESLGLNPMTKPFEYIKLNGKLRLYALKDATDQLRKRYGVSVTDLIESERDGVFIVTAKVRDATGRTDAAKGAVTIKGLQGENLANALMKCETKAKRRATMSICGLGFLDETEIEDIPSVETGRIKTLPKKDAREIFDRLQRELHEIAWRGDLIAWQTGSAERIKLLPEDWQDILRLKIEERAAEFRQREAEIAEPVVVTDTLADQPAEGEVIWAEPDETPPEHQDGWSKLSPTQQAGILCNDMVFERFLQEAHHIPEHLVVDFVRNRCLVKSRADIRDNHPSGRLWRELVAEYRAWQRDETPSAGATQAADPAAPVTSPLPDTEAGAADVIDSERLMAYEAMLVEAHQHSGQDGLRKAWGGIPAGLRKDPRMIAVKDRLKVS